MANNNEELPKIRLADSIGRAEEAQSISNETFIPIVEPVVGEEDKYFLKRYSAAFINDLNTLISEFNDFVVEMIGSEGMIYDIEDKVLENATNEEPVDVQSDLCAYPELLTNTIYNVEDNEYLEGVVLPTDLSNNMYHNLISVLMPERKLLQILQWNISDGWVMMLKIMYSHQYQTEDMP